MALTPEGTPYVESSDLVANYPAASLSLANRVDLVGVLPFASAAARTTAIPSPTDGQYSYLQDTNSTQFWNGSAWVAAGGKILQVVSTFKADTFTTTSTSLVDVTGLTLNITPSSVTSKIIVTVSLSLSNSNATGASRGAILRGATIVGGGTPAGNRGSITFFYRLNNAADGVGARAFMFEDSPATTSATTYKIQIAAESGTTAAIGYAYGNDNNITDGGRIGASIVLMEVSA